MPLVTTWRAALAVALLAVAAGAAQAAAAERTEVGQRLEIRSDAPLGRDAVRAVLAALEGGGRRNLEVQVRVERRGDGPVLTAIEVFGDGVTTADLTALARQAVPALASLPVTSSVVERAAQGNLGDRVEARLAGPELPPEALARALEAELRAAEPDAKVEVQVERAGDRKEVRVRVGKELETTTPEGGPERP